MPVYATVAELRARTTALNENQQLLKSIRAALRDPSESVFLSHSSADADLLPGVINLLEEHGGQVYTDKRDDSLPATTTRETAQALRKRIAKSRKFVLLATTKSKDSRWVPWELGVADGTLTRSKVAILPGVESVADVAWAEREYLGVYDRIVWGRLTGYDDAVWMVWNQEENVGEELGRWLKTY